jgi:hypothetical protein
MVGSLCRPIKASYAVGRIAEDAIKSQQYHDLVGGGGYQKFDYRHPFQGMD